MEHEPREPGSEEYLDSEKYQIRQRDLTGPTACATSSAG
jgi:starch synthase (maltosyl-transferring)